MAIKKSKVGRPKRKSVRKAGVKKASLGNTVKAFGNTYTKKSCSKLKTGATKAATAAKKAGWNAMVKKNPSGGYCVFVRRPKKTAK